MTRSLLAAALSLSAAGLTLSHCARHDRQDGGRDAAPGLRELAAALDDHRPIEPRLVGFSGYAPCRLPTVPQTLIPDPVCSRPPRPGDPESRAFWRAARRIQADAEAASSPAARHAAAVLDLVQGSARGASRAVTRLEGVVGAAPRAAGPWSDLAAARLVRAQRLDDPDGLVRSLEDADRAVALDTDLAEARFNRALVLDYLALSTAARTAWRGYLLLDGDSGWAEEARRRLVALTGPSAGARWQEQRGRLAAAVERGDRGAVAAIVRRDRQAAREHAEEELLGAWAEGRGRPAGAATLALARAIGAALAAAGGDRLVQSSVAAIDAAARPGGERRLAALAAGHRAFREGRALYRRGLWAAAAGRLAAARAALSSMGSPFAARAAYAHACCLYNMERRAEAEALLASVAGELPATAFPALDGHVSWVRALVRSVDGRPLDAVGEFERSLRAFAAAGEPSNAGSVHALLAEVLQLSGRRREAWSHQYEALRIARTLRDPLRLLQLYGVAADMALLQGRPAIALYFQDEAVRQAEAAADPGALADALFWRGLMRHRAGQRRPALADLRRARRQIARQPEELSRRRSAADISLIEGDLVLADDPRRATALFTAALSFYQEKEHPFLGLLAHLGRARACRRSGDLDGAETDLEAALAAYDRMDESLVRERPRLAFVATTEEVFDEMIAFQAVERGRPEAAFAAADRARTRVLPGGIARTQALDLGAKERRRLLAAEPAALPPAETLRRLPPGTALVQFSVLEDRVLIWRLRRQGMLSTEQAVSRQELERRVARLRRALAAAAGGREWTEASSSLFELLVRPWIGSVRPGETVVFVPDKALHLVPFACLLDRTTGRYLFQDYLLTVAPSATLYVTRSRRRGSTRADGERIPALVVADPAFDRALFPDLPPLPDAGAEAEAVARSLPGTVVLRGRGADRRSFLALAPRATLLHVASHAVLDARDPLRSRLVLASSGPRDPGALHAWELYGLDLSATRLAVLSSCRSGESPQAAEEGTASLARAFLAAGVPRVVASLWPVGDRIAARFFSAFYRQLRSDPDPARALRGAQLSFLAGHEESLKAPWAWGAFTVIVTDVASPHATDGGT